MGQIQELVERYCPDGVEYKKLGEVADLQRGKRVTRKDLVDGGEYPVYQNALLPLGYYSQTNQVADTPFVIIGGAAGEIGWSPCDFWAADDCCAVVGSETVGNRYLYHFLLSQKEALGRQVRRTAVPRLSRDVISNLEIPVPPLEVQQAIVAVLDSFVGLERELHAELDVRARQYEHYRDALMLSGDEIRLGDIGDVCMCKRVMKAETSPEGDIPFYKIGTFGKTPDAYISRELYEDYRSKYSFPRKGAILISAAGTVGRTVVYDGRPAYFQDSNIVWIDNDQSRVKDGYLRYAMQNVDWHTDGSTIKRLYNENLRRGTIHAPSLGEQERIVGLLDDFSALVDSIETEISVRHAQTEHYRDALLDLPRKGA